MKKPLTQLFSVKQAQLEANLISARSASDHPVRRGEAAEENWRKLLKDYLPERYRIEKAFVIDSDENVSKEIDGVIFDTYYTPIVFSETGHLYVSAESVYAAIEIKTNLVRQVVDDAVAKISSVRRLNRYTTSVDRAEGLRQPREFQRIIGIVLGSSWGLSGPPDTNFIEWASNWPDEGFIDLVSIGNGVALEIQKRSGGVSIVAGKKGFSTMFTLLTLARLLQSVGNVPPIDLLRYRRFVS